MKMVTTTALIAIVAAASLSAKPFETFKANFNGADSTQQPAKKVRFKRFNRACSPFKEITLDEAQRDAVKTLAIELKEALKEAKNETTAPMFAAVESGTFDKTAYIDASTANQAVIIDIRADHADALFSVLTPEQQAQYVANLDNIENNDSCPGPSTNK